VTFLLGADKTIGDVFISLSKVKATLSEDLKGDRKVKIREPS